MCTTPWAGPAVLMHVLHPELGRISCVGGDHFQLQILLIVLIWRCCCQIAAILGEIPEETSWRTRDICHGPCGPTRSVLLLCCQPQPIQGIELQFSPVQGHTLLSPSPISGIVLWSPSDLNSSFLV